ncbi:hypothetical protein [Helicobacter sp. 12S02232-10]|nr:hypothetical protein [Helicobacter sp. 12S02232-10]
MGFEVLGLKVFDLSKPFGYAEVFSTIAIVCLIAFIGFYILRIKSKK